MGFIPENVIVNLKKEIAASGGAAVEELTTRVQTLESTVGDETSGLVKDVDDLETVVGDSSGGLVKTVIDQGAILNTLTPNNYSLPTISGDAIISGGGYFKIGNAVYVNMRITASADTSVVLSNFPSYTGISHINVAPLMAINVTTQSINYSYIGDGGLSGTLNLQNGQSMLLMGHYLADPPAATRNSEDTEENDLK